jgi:superfamily II DNA or RNA helicase
MKKSRLYFYVVHLVINGKTIVKFGQTIQLTKDDAITYAVNETAGKLRATINSEDVIYCEDVTHKVIQHIKDGSYTKGTAPNYEKYDDFVRDNFVKKNKLHKGSHSYYEKNDVNGGSREIHYYASSTTRYQLTEEWTRLMNDFIHGNTNKNSFKPRPYCQLPAIEKVTEYILNLHKQGIVNLPRKVRRFLLNGKMRFGKCFVTYKIAKEVGYKRILILTYKPSGVDESWEDDLDHVDFPNAKFIRAKQMDSIKFDDNFDGIQVIFASFQDAIGEDGNKQKWNEIKNQEIDMLVIDEMHYGSDTKKALDVVNSLNHKFTLNLSGTPLKALQRGSYNKNQQYHWTYMDEQFAKKNWNYSFGDNPYEWLPELQIKIMKFDKKFRDSFFEQYSNEESPTMEKIFSKPQLIDLFIERQLWGRYGIYLNYDVSHGFVSLPSVKACNNFEKSVKRNPKFNQFEIINVAGDGEKRIDEVKRRISNSSKSITISCGRFDTGSTIPQLDYTLMLTNGKSAERYWQTVFRPGTPWKDGDKKTIYSFDFDYNRVLQVVGVYAKVLSDNSSKPINRIVREMLDTMPIHSIGDGDFENVDVDDVLGYFVNNNLSDNLGSSYLFNSENITNDVANILDIYTETTSFSKFKRLNVDGEKNGKTYKPNLQSKKLNLKPKEETNFVNKARTLTKRISGLIYINQNVTNVDSLFVDSNLFESMIGISSNNFKIILDSGFIDIDELNETITSVNTQMHHI